MKILLLGKDGQVGWELQRSLAPVGEVVALGRQELDLTQLHLVPGRIADIAPDIVINASAYTAVDDAETHIGLANLINADLVGVLAREAQRANFWLVHYSTDYVFSGTKTDCYLETDQPDPGNVYGTSKLAGEQAIAESGCNHLVLRTSWLHSPRARNFIRTILRLAQTREEIQVVDDQFGAPTSAELIADVSALLAREIAYRQARSGTYHLTAAGRTSWYDYARVVVQSARDRGVQVRVAEDGIRALPTARYKTAAHRPANSCLDTTLIRNTFGLSLPTWQSGVERTLTELIERQS